MRSMCWPAPAGPGRATCEYFADTKIGDFGTPLARAQIAAALGMLGDKPRAEQPSPSARRRARRGARDAERTSRSDYGSRAARRRRPCWRSPPKSSRAAGRPDGSPSVIADERAQHRYASHAGECLDGARRPRRRSRRHGRSTLDGRRRARSTGALYRTFTRRRRCSSPCAVAQHRRRRRCGPSSPYRLADRAASPPARERHAPSSGTYYTLAGTPVDPAQVRRTTARRRAEGDRAGRTGGALPPRRSAAGRLRDREPDARRRAAMPATCPGSTDLTRSTHPSSATTASSRPSTAPGRSSRSPIWCARWRPAPMSHPGGGGRGHVPARAQCAPPPAR